MMQQIVSQSPGQAPQQFKQGMNHNLFSTPPPSIQNNKQIPQQTNIPMRQGQGSNPNMVLKQAKQPIQTKPVQPKRSKSHQPVIQQRLAPSNQTSVPQGQVQGVLGSKIKPQPIPRRFNQNSNHVPDNQSNPKKPINAANQRPPQGASHSVPRQNLNKMKEKLKNIEESKQKVAEFYNQNDLLIEDIFSITDIQRLFDVIKVRNDQLIDLVSKGRSDCLSFTEEAIQVTQDALNIVKDEQEICLQRQKQLKSDSQKISNIYQTQLAPLELLSQLN
ncbi:UNKNOWN [Stylonychia lemnae]|uniref:Uncharacterized protein n=1 Tax=Stylonychia lemnae TaxID=5949 RepID=A0A078AZI4_STYLE|nr:UNKNOWN [Stylonychia lemnae]|eukprot:CDW87521.1 UNKNOWN [Stylonychia lemnae]